METLSSLLSTYELFNNIFPGIIFSYFLSLQNYNIIPNKIDIYEKLFLYYFIGLIISRIGSLFLEPFFRKFADYTKFLKAEEKNNKIAICVRVNNMYRSLIIVFFFNFLYLLYLILQNNFLFCTLLAKLLFILSFFFLFVFSYRKQTEYIRKRVENFQINKEEQKNEI